MIRRRTFIRGWRLFETLRLIEILRYLRINLLSYMDGNECIRRCSCATLWAQRAHTHKEPIMTPIMSSTQPGGMSRREPRPPHLWLASRLCKFYSSFFSRQRAVAYGQRHTRTHTRMRVSGTWVHKLWEPINSSYGY